MPTRDPETERVPVTYREFFVEIEALQKHLDDRLTHLFMLVTFVGGLVLLPLVYLMTH